MLSRGRHRRRRVRQRKGGMRGEAGAPVVTAVPALVLTRLADCHRRKK